MLSALIIVFREVIEAGLIVGIVLAATQGVAGRGRWIAIGIGGGVWGAALVAAFAGMISEAFEGTGQELLNAGVLLTAVVMLIWHNAWMARHGRELAAEMKAVGHDVRSGRKSLAALAVVVGVAVLREGAEVVLFLYGIVAAGTSVLELLLGGVLGLVAGAAVSLVSYLGLVSIPARYLFGVTSALVTLLAAGLASQGVQYLNAAGVIDMLDRTVWNTSGWISEESLGGRILRTLVGYTDRPTQLQLLAYVTTIVVMVAMMRLAATKPRPAGAPVPSRA